MKKCLLPVAVIPLLLILSCEKDISVTPDDVLITNNHLVVDSNPQGSAIFVDSINTGQYTPDTLNWIDSGDHLITLKKKLFADFSIPVTVSGAETKHLFFDYTTNPQMLGRLYIDSEPRGADIYLNDSNTTFKTPKAIDGLFPGIYKVGYKLNGYWDLETNVSVISNRSITIDKTLIDSLEWVNYNRTTVGLTSNFFNAIDIQNEYIKWIGSTDAGLFRYDDNEWTIYNTENSFIPSNKVLSIDAAADIIWIGTDNGAARFNSGEWQIYNSSNSPLESNQINSITVDQSGRVWMATYDKGIYILEGSSWINYNSSNSPLPTDFTNTIYEDTEGKIWIGTYGGGLVSFDGSNWTIITDGLPLSLNVISVFNNNSGLWAGCHSFGLLSGGTAGRINNAWNIYQNFPSWDITADLQNVLWFATEGGGLMKYNGASWQSFNVLNSKILSNKVTGIAIDGRGHKWLSTFGGGISKYKGN